MDKTELRQILAEEKALYLSDPNIKKFRHIRYYIWKYLLFFRKAQFYYAECRSKNAGRLGRRLYKFLYRRFNKKRNLLGLKTGVEIGLGTRLGKNCNIWHSGVVLNGEIGDNCIFHGSNIVGENKTKTPVLGNNVELGVGAVVIGGVYVADGCVIGAKALVNKSVEEKGCRVAGVPARKF
ncbi:MAG: hypothetical protein IJL87_09230 [Clostridia bacterium]|nr:hypothetical protein [Clostridia bacterium]